MGDGLDIDLRSDVQNEPPKGPWWRQVIDWFADLGRNWGPPILAVFIIRSVLIEPFQIPSGSMVPTLAIGDFILVSKITYGLRVPFTEVEILPLGEPERGDIVVFTHPPTRSDDPWCFVKRLPGRTLAFLSVGNYVGPEACDTDYIKRIVGLPGDTIEVRDNLLFVNGDEQPRRFMQTHRYVDQSCHEEEMREFEELVDGRPHPVLQTTSYAKLMSDHGPIKVGGGHYFVMGDNRDNSADSRVWGEVPRHYIKGKAMAVWLSFDGCTENIPGLGTLRTERIGKGLE